MVSYFSEGKGVSQYSAMGFSRDWSQVYENAEKRKREANVVAPNPMDSQGSNQDSPVILDEHAFNNFQDDEESVDHHDNYLVVQEIIVDDQEVIIGGEDTLEDLRSLGVEEEDHNNREDIIGSGVFGDGNIAPTSATPSSLDIQGPLTPTSGSSILRESCSFELMRLLDKAGSPRYLYDDVNALLKKHFKKGFPVIAAMSRELLLKKMYQQFPSCPNVEERVVSGYSVFKFPFVGMLQDLLDYSFGSIGGSIHIIDKDVVCKNNDTNQATKSELWNSPWMKQTFEQCESYRNFDPRKEIMLPLIIYMDKTGTDSLQRYSLEPVLFTTAAIPREAREKSSAWRHLGFIPPFSQNDGKDQQKHQTQLQVYHDFLSVLLDDLILAQKHPPTVTIKQNGQYMNLLARIPVMIVMGDQKSQDTLCARKHANSGGAGRVHRSCMCSYLTVDDSTHKCVDVCLKTIRRLTNSALMPVDKLVEIAGQHSNSCDAEKAVTDNYLKRQQAMNTAVLQYPYTQHAIRNAFDPVDFGAWESGIFKATFDDFMHSTESGLFEYTAELFFEALTQSETQAVEAAIRRILVPVRSSVRQTFPRWVLKEGFSSMSRTTCAEKVGTLFILLVTLQYKSVSTIVNKAQARQRQGYLTFPKLTKKPKDADMADSNSDEEDWDQYEDHRIDPPPPKKSKKKNHDVHLETEEKKQAPLPQNCYFWQKHMPPRLDDAMVEKRLITMARHGFDIKILETLDMLQIHSLISHCDLGACEYPSSYPKCNIPGHYKNLGLNFKIPKHLLQKAIKAFSAPTKEDILSPTRFVPVEGTILKHYRQKVKEKGVGNTAAILTEDAKSFQYFIEYLMSFHSFCRYSVSLPIDLQQNLDLVDFGSRTVVQYFEKMVYRGDNTVDSRTTKVHANMRVGLNHSCLGSCMHADCQTGERLLKTKAKKVSATAQQRGNSTFEKQTMHRIRDEIIMSKYETFMKEEQQKSNDHAPNPTGDQTGAASPGNVTRHIANFRYIPITRRWIKLDRKGNNVGVADIDVGITEAYLELEPNETEYELYGEIQLKDKSFVRATPDYSQTGPWYDYVNVKWMLEGNKTLVYPARCLGFYKKKDIKDGSVQIMALVHGTDKPKSTGGTSSLDTMLTLHYWLEYDAETKKPKIYTVSISTIESVALCFHHQFREKDETLFPRDKSGLMLVRPRSDWSYVWMVWNQVLQKSNSRSGVGRRKSFIGLGNRGVVGKVKKKLEELHGIKS